MSQTYEGVVHNGVVQLPADARLPDGTRVQVVPMAALDEKQARRKAAHWLAEHVGILAMPLHGEFIGQDQRACWRFSVWLSSPFHQPRGPVGVIDVDVMDGVVLSQSTLRDELIHNAEKFVGATSSPNI